MAVLCCFLLPRYMAVTGYALRCEKIPHARLFWRSTGLAQVQSGGTHWLIMDGRQGRYYVWASRKILRMEVAKGISGCDKRCPKQKLTLS